MRVLVFSSDNGQDCTSYYLVSTKKDMDLATLNYLSTLGSFQWDEDTVALEEQVKRGDDDNLYATLVELVGAGYDCFNLDRDYGISVVNFTKYKEK